MPLTKARLRNVLEDMAAPELRELVQALFAASADNKRLLAAQLDEDSSELRTRLSSELDKAFRPVGRLPSLKVGAAKKALSTYLKVASPLEALDAELSYVGAGVRCLHAYGDWPENNYSSMESVFGQALARAARLPADQIAFERLERLVKDSGGFGYGFSDQLASLYDRFLERLQDSGTWRRTQP